MTAEGIPPITSDEGLMNFANCALKMLREAPRIQRADEVSDDFLSEVAVILFGSDIVPYVRPFDSAQRKENITAILNKLANEIDLKLDHICPSDVVLGDRKAVSNMLELLTAFILHCVHEDLLDFDRTNSSHPSYHDPSAVEFDVPGSSNYASNTHLSMSPEIPRASLNRLHVFPMTPGQSSVQPSESSELRRPLQILTCGPTQNHFVRTNTTSPTKTEFLGTSTIEASSQEQVGRSSSAAVIRLTPMQRLHPYFSLPSDCSPPATPNGADGMVEIAKHQSPPVVPPSLQCSPAVDGSEHQVIYFANPSDKSLSPTHWNAVSNKTTVTSSATGVSHQLVSEINQSSPAPSDLNSDSSDDSGELKQTAIPQRRLNRKTSSSSSGRGHSPTQTLTAPGASVTSTPSSLSESSPPSPPPPLPPLTAELPRTQKALMTPRDVACQTIGDIISKSSHGRRTRLNPPRHADSAHLSVHGSCASVATTNSILAWSTDHHSCSKSELYGGPGNSTASVLSSSFQSKPCAQGRTCPSPSASVLFAHTEGFSQALKRRLDYLRMIFSRAHDEAEAVGQLVQLIGSQHLDTLEFMEQCLRKDQRTDQEPTDANAKIPYSFKPLEQMVQRILLGIEVLLKRHSTPPGRSVHRRHSATRLRFPVHRRSTERSRKPMSNPDSKNDNAWMLQFEELMTMKHSLMVDTLTWLLSELQSKGRSTSESTTPLLQTMSQHRLGSSDAVCV